jgi:transcriptional regulator with XRE-family HTH domain
MKSIKQKIKDKGITNAQVAKMVGIDQATLSRIINGSQSYVSKDVEDKIHVYLDALNTDDKNIFNKK